MIRNCKQYRKVQNEKQKASTPTYCEKRFLVASPRQNFYVYASM